MKKLFLIPFLFSTFIKADFDSDLRGAGNEELNQWLNVQDMGRKVDEHRTRINMLEKEFQEALDNYLKQQQEELNKKELFFESIEKELATIKAAKIAEIKEFVKSFGESKSDLDITNSVAHCLVKELENEVHCGDATLKILALRLMSEKVWLAMWAAIWEEKLQLFFKQNDK